jgi:pseudouridine synthase
MPGAETKKRPLKTLERVLSKAGLGSRSDARSWVHAGRVKVNGKVTRNPDHWVDMKRDTVRFDDKTLRARERLYLLLYKPTGYLTTYKDPQGRPTVYDLVDDVPTFVRPVGRLDLDTSGLLLMTNDNQFAERVTNPESHVPKTYLVKASKVLSDAELLRLRDGIELADGCTRPAKVKRLRDSGKYTHFEITLTEGRNYWLSSRFQVPRGLALYSGGAGPGPRARVPELQPRQYELARPAHGVSETVRAKWTAQGLGRSVHQGG